MPLSIAIALPTYMPWSVKYSGTDAEIKRFVEATNGKDIEFNPPPGHKYSTLKFPMYFDKARKCMTMKANQDGIPLLTLEEWFEHPMIKELVEDVNIVDEILYYKGATFSGPTIEEDEAFLLSKSVDPSTKPASKRPGKRVSTPPESPVKKPATSSSSDAPTEK